MVVILKQSVRFESYPNSPGFSDEPGLFCINLSDVLRPEL
jgi:hypothetical protein